MNDSIGKVRLAKMVVAEFTWRVKVGFVLVLLAWIFNLICFVTPFWLVSWPRIHTPFNSLGLWEFCLNGYMVRSDPTMRSYFGCWWVFAPEFSPIQKILMPCKSMQHACDRHLTGVRLSVHASSA